MAAPPFPVCWANRRGAAAIAVAAAPVASMLRLIGSIIGALLDHFHGRCVRLEAPECCADDRFRDDPWCTGIVVQVVLALKGRMPGGSAWYWGCVEFSGAALFTVSAKAAAF